jgi:hypothetical protein
MKEIIIGYGEFLNFRLQEIPDLFLLQLAESYPLKSTVHDSSEWKHLFVTIAVHEELKRREAGGVQVRRRPTQRELALQVVAKGFHSLSQIHHPDRNGGDSETQKLLTLARDFLSNACKEIEEYHAADAVIIEDPYASLEITDDDIPF